MAEPFRYRKQPLKGLYQLYTLVHVAVALPLWIVLAAIPATRQRRAWPVQRSIFVRLFQLVNAAGYATDFSLFEVDVEKNARQADALGFVWVDPVPVALVRGEVAEMAKVNGVAPARVSGYWYGARDADGKHGQKAAPGEKVLYALHCGGFVLESAWPKGTSTPIYTELLKHTAPHGPTRLFGLDYRLAVAPPFGSANAFPAALIDALAGYAYLVDALGFSPADITVVGDSAGGALAVQLLRYLAAEAPYPQPGAAVLLSPSVDWGYELAPTAAAAESSAKKNAATDFVAKVFTSGYTRAALLGRLPPEAADGPWISPASLKVAQPAGLFRGFPRTLIIAGGAEQTRDPMVTLCERIRNDVGEDGVKYLEYPDAVHDFAAFSWHEPERTQALQSIAEWMNA